MKRARSRDSSSIFFISKWVVIVALVIVSSLSFVLGYYVGKHDNPLDTDHSSIMPTDQGMSLNDTAVDNRETTQQKPLKNQDAGSHTSSVAAEGSQDTAEQKQPSQAKQVQSPKPQKSQVQQKDTAKITYTVQAGAFKSSQDAENLKDKLVKKGYTAYIVEAESKKHEKLYKVMIGRFPTRKQAEALSLKIKKSEGLQTFVTFRTKEDILR